MTPPPAASGCAHQPTAIEPGGPLHNPVCSSHAPRPFRSRHTCISTSTLGHPCCCFCCCFHAAVRAPAEHAALAWPRWAADHGPICTQLHSVSSPLPTPPFPAPCVRMPPCTVLPLSFIQQRYTVQQQLRMVLLISRSAGCTLGCCCQTAACPARGRGCWWVRHGVKRRAAAPRHAHARPRAQ